MAEGVVLGGLPRRHQGCRAVSGTETRKGGGGVYLEEEEEDVNDQLARGDIARLLVRVDQSHQLDEGSRA